MLELTGNAIFGTGLAIGLSVGGVAFVLSLAIFNNINGSLRMRCKIAEASGEGAVGSLMESRKLQTEAMLQHFSTVRELKNENSRLQRLVEKNL